MRVHKWIALGLMATALSISTLADHRNSNRNDDENGRFRASLIGSVPNSIVGGVASGGAPWTVQEAAASIFSEGKLKVEVVGLLITAGPNVPPAVVGTVGPVRMVAASVVCGGSGGTVAASTGGVPFDSVGNAEIESAVTLPSSCLAPVVLVRIFNASASPGSQLGPFIAVSGLNSSASGNGDNDRDDH
jgi:hypothetical protein